MIRHSKVIVERVVELLLRAAHVRLAAMLVASGLERLRARAGEQQDRGTVLVQAVERVPGDGVVDLAGHIEFIALRIGNRPGRAPLLLGQDQRAERRVGEHHVIDTREISGRGVSLCDVEALASQVLGTRRVDLVGNRASAVALNQQRAIASARLQRPESILRPRQP